MRQAAAVSTPVCGPLHARDGALDNDGSVVVMPNASVASMSASVNERMNVCAIGNICPGN